MNNIQKGSVDKLGGKDVVNFNIGRIVNQYSRSDMMGNVMLQAMDEHNGFFNSIFG